MLFDSFMLYLVERDHAIIFEPNLDPTQLRVSSIPYCNRKAYFEKIGYENTSSNYLLRQATEGRIHHTDTQIAAEEFSQENPLYEVEIERPISYKLDEIVEIRGSIDMLFRNTTTGHYTLVDVKATTSKGWYNTREYGAYQSHQDQVLLYKYMLICEFAEGDVERIYGNITGELWYKNRNDGQWIKQPVLYDQSRINYLIEKTKNLIESIRIKIPPDKYCPMYEYECSSKSGQCPFHTLCYKDGEFKKYQERDDKDE